MRGKRLPQIGKIEVAVVEETNPRLLMFNAGEVDLIEVPPDVAPKMIDGAGQLLPEYAERGIRLERGMELTVTFTYFNMEDPVVGGYAADRVALRRAICSAYNRPDEINVIRNGQGQPATEPIPPDLEGQVRGFTGYSPYDPATARALLDKFGYADRDADGFRKMPDGRPLVIHMASLTGAVYRQFDELWQRSLRDVGIRMDFRVQNFPETFKAAHEGHLQFSGFSWNAETADDFMRLFYGPNSGAGNLARFRNTEFDTLYEKSRRMPDMAERNQLYEAMTRIVSAQAPWCTLAYRISNTAVAPWIRGYRKNAHFLIPLCEYLDIDLAARKSQRR